MQLPKDDYHKMIIIISGSKVVDIKEEEIVHCMGKKRGYSARNTLKFIYLLYVLLLQSNCYSSGCGSTPLVKYNERNLTWNIVLQCSFCALLHY